MKIQRAYKTELAPNNVQKTLLRKHSGAARFAWNWALARIKAKTSKPNAIALHRELNALKPTDFPWMYEVSKCAPQEALRNLQTAFGNFFKANKSGKKAGSPKFKSRRNAKQSFKLTGTISIESGRIQLPRLGWLKLKEHDYLPTGEETHILSATCSEHAGKWFVAISVEEETAPVESRSGVLGIDLGIKTLAVCSDGTTFENPKALRNKQKQLRKLQRRFARQQKGSKRRAKTKARIAKLHYRISCIRKDAIHKATAWVAKTKLPEVVVMEDLNVKGMMQNHRLAQSVSDASFHEFRFQMQYKQEWEGGSVMVADRYFPSSKTCSNCGCVKEELRLSERVYVCDCGMTKDRDWNAAINLEKYGMGLLKGKTESVSSTADARGAAMVVEQPQRSENQTAILSGYKIV